MINQIFVSSGKTSRGLVLSNHRNLFVDHGGKTINTKIYNGVQYLRGIASQTTISNTTKAINKLSYAAQYVEFGGNAIQTNILGNSALMVVHGGVARNTTIDSGGVQEVFDGTVYSTTVNSGFLSVGFGGKAINTKVANSKNAIIQLFDGGRLEYSSRVILGGNLEIFNHGNSINRLYTNNSTEIKFYISNNPHRDDYGLTLGQRSTNYGTYSVVVSKIEQAGTYKLAKNLNSLNSTQYSVYLRSDKNKQTILGTNSINSRLVNNGVAYTLSENNNNLTLKIALRYGSMLKGTNGNNNLTGTRNCDIFYGGQGNDTINGIRGRDVAIYDSTNWGKDTINKTSGTMTILFNNIDLHNILFKESNNNVTLTNRRDRSQTITIRGWDHQTHNIMYTRGINAFSSYLRQTNPSSSTIANVRKSVWHKAGLTQRS